MHSTCPTHAAMCNGLRPRPLLTKSPGFFKCFVSTNVKNTGYPKKPIGKRKNKPIHRPGPRWGWHLFDPQPNGSKGPYILGLDDSMILLAAQGSWAVSPNSSNKPPNLPPTPPKKCKTVQRPQVLDKNHQLGFKNHGKKTSKKFLDPLRHPKPNAGGTRNPRPLGHRRPPGPPAAAAAAPRRPRRLPGAECCRLGRVRWAGGPNRFVFFNQNKKRCWKSMAPSK